MSKQTSLARFAGLAFPHEPAQEPFRHFDSSPEVIRLAVMMYVRYPLSLRSLGPSNHFNQERHLISRDDYKTRRSDAMAGWENVAA